MKLKWLFLSVIAISCLWSVDTSQCQFTCHQSGDKVFIPSIPDFYFNPDKVQELVATLTPATEDRTYIFPFPDESSTGCGDECSFTETELRSSSGQDVPTSTRCCRATDSTTPAMPFTRCRNCSGAVKVVEYCYQVANNRVLQDDEPVFILHSMNASTTSRQHHHFIPTSSCVVNTTASRNCTTDSAYCCDRTELDDNQFIISPSDYALGVHNIRRDALQLKFMGNFTTERYILHQSTDYTVMPPCQCGSLLLLRFLLARQGNISPTLSSSTSSTAGTESSSVSGDISTSGPSDAISTSNTHSTNDISTTIVESPSSGNYISTSVTAGSSDNLSIMHTGDSDKELQKSKPAIIGGLVGAVLLMLTVTFLAVCMVVVIKRRKKIAECDDSGITLGNAVYGANTGESTEAYREYAGVGPQVSTGSMDSSKLLHDGYEYAAIGAAYEIPSVQKDDSTNDVKKEDNIYVVPAENETGLYAQLQEIMTQYIARSSIKLGERLGSGQFGVVYKGVLECGEGEGGKVEVAVKTLKEGSGEGDRVKFLQEAAIMGQFKHHNVVTMYGVVTVGEPVLLVLELLSGGDLRDHLLQMRPDVDEQEVSVDDHTLLSYCRQVASGMAYLSGKAFVHRDLAARNILVSDDGICKIADFGMSRDLMDESYYVSHGGKIPVKWTAPEALHYKKYSTASDVWSFGVVMYEIWSLGHKPFEKETNSKVMRLLESGYRLPPPPGCPRALYNIMITCWHPETSLRPKFQDVSRQLSLPDPKLLKWSEEDKAVHPEAAKLGTGLLSAQELYKDLQTLYQSD